MAKALGSGLPISTKHSVEICNLIRNMKLAKAKELLEAVVSKKKAVPFKRHNADVGHKTGIGPGRYPIKASGEVLSILKTAEHNALSNDLSKDKLVIAHINAQKASTPWRSGRHRRRKAKRTHIEVVLKEAEEKVKEKQKNKETGKGKTEEKKKVETKEIPKENKEQEQKNKINKIQENKNTKIKESKNIKTEEQNKK